MRYLKRLIASAVPPRVRLVLVIVAAVMMLRTMDAQTVNWVEVESGTPSPRTSMGMAYDLATKSTVLFGGLNFGTYGDTWNWREGWLPLSPATSPSPRYGPGMAYDAAAGNIVLFGGESSTGTYYDDTWTWDGTTWTQQFPPVSPPARNVMGMVYDAATQTVVLFGGINSAGHLGDTWTWDGVLPKLGHSRIPPPVHPHEVKWAWLMTQRPEPPFYLAATATTAWRMATPGLGMELLGPNTSRRLPRPFYQEPP